MTPATNVDWQEHAACAGQDEHLFFDADDNYATALRICADCPVRATCLDYALSTGTDHGVYGGTVPADRANLRRELGINLKGRTPRSRGHGTQYGYQRLKCRCEHCRAAWAAYNAAYRARRKNQLVAVRARRAS